MSCSSYQEGLYTFLCTYMFIPVYIYLYAKVYRYLSTYIDMCVQDSFYTKLSLQSWSFGIHIFKMSIS